jgi:WD40 repeat protein
VGNGDRTASVWDIAARQELYVLTNHGGFVQAVVFAPDGKTLLTASQDKTLRLWDVASAKLQSSIKAAHEPRFGNGFSPDSSLIVYSGSAGVLTLWNVKQQKVDRSWRGHPTEVFATAFSPDGRTLASSCRQMIKLWDIRTGAELARLDGLRGTAFSLLFTPDAKTLIVPEVSGDIRLWHMPSLREAGVIKAPMNLISSALSPDGNVLATCSLEGVRLFRAAGLESGVSSHSR